MNVLHVLLRLFSTSHVVLTFAITVKKPAGLSGGPTPVGELQQVLVIDAGSSGSRIHIFNLFPAAQGSHIPTIDQSVRKTQTLKVRPGLSKFALTGDLDGAADSVQKLLTFADQFVKPENRFKTPVLVKATAGLRAVATEKADLVLDRVRQTLASSHYEHRDDWVRIIPGKEEGGLAWVAANYLAGTFSSSIADHYRPRDSLGVLEMGGGSMQVTFEVGPEVTVAEEDSFVFTTLLGRSFQLYAHSYLGFGQDHAQEKLRSAVILSQLKEDPCYPSWYGYSSNQHGSNIAGTGSSSNCKDAVDATLLTDSDMAPGKYRGEPPLLGRFIATENFFYERDRLNLPLRGDIESMQAAAQAACEQRQRPDIEAPQGGGAPSLAEPTGCFGLTYQVAILKALFSSQASSVPEIEIVHKIRGGDVDWALGAALVHSLESAAVEDSKMLVDPSGAVSVSVLAFLDLITTTVPTVLVICALAGAIFFLTFRMACKSIGELPILECPKKH
jgi:hypothetical protein